MLLCHLVFYYCIRNAFGSPLNKREALFFAVCGWFVGTYMWQGECVLKQNSSAYVLIYGTDEQETQFQSSFSDRDAVTFYPPVKPQLFQVFYDIWKTTQAGNKP